MIGLPIPVGVRDLTRRTRSEFCDAGDVTTSRRPRRPGCGAWEVGVPALGGVSLLVHPHREPGAREVLDELPDAVTGVPARRSSRRACPAVAAASNTDTGGYARHTGAEAGGAVRGTTPESARVPQVLDRGRSGRLRPVRRREPRRSRCRRARPVLRQPGAAGRAARRGSPARPPRPACRTVTGAAGLNFAEATDSAVGAISELGQSASPVCIGRPPSGRLKHPDTVAAPRTPRPRLWSGSTITPWPDLVAVGGNHESGPVDNPTETVPMSCWPAPPGGLSVSDSKPKANGLDLGRLDAGRRLSCQRCGRFHRI